jgi:hypothetical protein
VFLHASALRHCYEFHLKACAILLFTLSICVAMRSTAKAPIAQRRDSFLFFPQRLPHQKLKVGLAATHPFRRTKLLAHAARTPSSTSSIQLEQSGHQTVPEPVYRTLGSLDDPLATTSDDGGGLPAAAGAVGQRTTQPEAGAAMPRASVSVDEAGELSAEVDEGQEEINPYTAADNVLRLAGGDVHVVFGAGRAGGVGAS